MSFIYFQSTYCSTIVKHCESLRRVVHVVNLDPAAEYFNYPKLAGMTHVIHICTRLYMINPHALHYFDIERPPVLINHIVLSERPMMNICTITALQLTVIRHDQGPLVVRDHIFMSQEMIFLYLYLLTVSVKLM